MFRQSKEEETDGVSGLRLPLGAPRVLLSWYRFEGWVHVSGYQRAEGSKDAHVLQCESIKILLLRLYQTKLKLGGRVDTTGMT